MIILRTIFSLYELHPFDLCRILIKGDSGLAAFRLVDHGYKAIWKISLAGFCHSQGVPDNLRFLDLELHCSQDLLNDGQCLLISHLVATSQHPYQLTKNNMVYETW